MSLSSLAIKLQMNSAGSTQGGGDGLVEPHRARWEAVQTLSLDTLWENEQVPSVFLHVPRRNLLKHQKERVEHEVGHKTCSFKP